MTDPPFHPDAPTSPPPVLPPGLAWRDSTLIGGRYAIVHVNSGLSLPGLDDRCRIHIDQASALIATLSAEHDVDWTFNSADLRGQDGAALRAKVIDIGHAVTAEIDYSCRLRACGQPDAPAWGVRCTTCNWAWSDENDEGPLDGKTAKDIADEHECDPNVQIMVPASGGEPERWVTPSDVSMDGELRPAVDHG